MFNVGDVALLDLPAGPSRVRVVEDRGNLGVGGRRVLRVERLIDEPELRYAFEIPEDLLHKDTPETRRAMVRARREEFRRIARPPAA